jgi:hypothetical protein
VTGAGLSFACKNARVLTSLPRAPLPMTLLHAWWSRPGARSACGAVAAVVCLLLLLFAPWPPLAGQPSDATGGSYGSAPRTGALSGALTCADTRSTLRADE